MSTYHLLPVRILNQRMTPSGADPITIPTLEFIRLAAPTGQAAARTILGSGQVRVGTYVGYLIRKEFFSEGLLPAPLAEMLEKAIQIGRRAHMDREFYHHPFSAFVLRRKDLGTDMGWLLKEDPTIEQRLVAAWKVLNIIPPEGVGVIEGQRYE